MLSPDVRDSPDAPALHPSSPEGERIALGGISVIVPEGWVVQQPSSSMRKAQYALGRQAADAEDGELAVFYFGSGSAGGVAANLDRWRKQITPAEGSPPSDPQTRTVDGMAVTVLDLEGLYKAGMGPMMAPGPPKSAYRMVAAIVESPAGAYYFKLTGPSATIAHNHEQRINSKSNRAFCHWSLINGQWSMVTDPQEPPSISPPPLPLHPT